MLRNFILTFVRNLLRENVYAIINILGLAIGLGCVLLIALYINQESSFDEFHRDADRMYRLAQYALENGNDNFYAQTGGPCAEDLMNDIPEMESTVRITPWTSRGLANNEKEITPKKILAADSNFFDFFSFELIEGNARDVLDGPNKVVLTTTAASALFAPNEKPIGKLLTLKGSEPISLEVTGIVLPPPLESHFGFDIIVSMATGKLTPYWLDTDCHTYFKVNPNVDPAIIDKKILESSKRHVGPMLQRLGLDKSYEIGRNMYFFKQPITSIHLDSHLSGELSTNGNRTHLIVLMVIGAVIILLACFNFVNLSTARAVTRAKEIAVRRTAGATHNKIITQFLLEAACYTCISIVVALGLLSISLNSFNLFIDTHLAFEQFFEGWIPGFILLLVLVVAGIGGLLPSIYLTRFLPAEVLRNKFSSVTTGISIRSMLVIAQFMVSAILITFTYTVFRQVHFMRTKELGFTTEQLICIPNAGSLGNKRSTFQQIMEESSEVVAASYTDFFPSEIQEFSLALTNADNGEPLVFRGFHTDGKQDEALGLQVLAGRFFDDQNPADSVAVVINQRAAQMMGVQALENCPILKSNYDVNYKVVGILNDFNYESLHSAPRPLIILQFDKESQKSKMIVRVAAGDLNQQVASLEKTWKQYSSSPFEFIFMDDAIASMYSSDQTLGQLAFLFTVLGLGVAGIGLLGLVAFLMSRRTKEIGVRRVLGASIAEVVVLMSKNLVALAFFGFAVSVPISYYIASHWLERFPYRVGVSLTSVLVSGGVIILIAFVTVTFQSMRAASGKPITYLRSE